MLYAAACRAPSCPRSLCRSSPHAAAAPAPIITAAGGNGSGDMGTLSDAELLQKLLALTAKCTPASNGQYATDEGQAASIDICKLDGAFFWRSDLDIDCDGQTTTQCNASTDDAYFDDTSFQQSDGKPLSAAALPYVVVPLPSTRFDYMASDIQPGAVAAVLYGNQIEWAVFGDEGPDDIIGEASYATAKALGINPDPNTGGAESGATFIVFSGARAVVDPIENHDHAVTLGQQLAAHLVQSSRHLEPGEHRPAPREPQAGRRHRPVQSGRKGKKMPARRRGSH